MSTTSAFEVLGPIMIGPSSSHTAGALRIAMLAKSLVKSPIKRVEFTLYNSFARTHKGHGTDRALLGGILGFEAHDPRIKTSFEEADKAGLDYEFIISEKGEGIHPNSVDICMYTESGRQTSVRGESLGGGRIAISKINGVDVVLTGDYNTIFAVHQDTCGVLSHTTQCLAEHQINIAFMRTFRSEKSGLAYTIFETDEEPNEEVIGAIEHCEHVKSAMLIKIPGNTAAPGLSISSDFISGAELLELCAKEHKSIGQLMYEREVQLSGKQEAQEGMKRVLEVMKDEVKSPLEHAQISLGGLIGGEAQSIYQAASQHKDLFGETRSKASAYAMAVLERSASMGVIVAAPTAGASGVVPGVLLSAAECLGSSDEELINALYTASAVGYLIMRNATVAGAEGGCQAEVGSASAMAAAALAELMGAEPKVALYAACIALSNMLGLVCDPIGGLVEAPCQMRNAGGASQAYTAVNLALSGVVSLVPFDEVIETMFRVGKQLPSSLRETAEGGLAITPSACELCARCGVL